MRSDAGREQRSEPVHAVLRGPAAALGRARRDSPIYTRSAGRRSSAPRVYVAAGRPRHRQDHDLMQTEKALGEAGRVMCRADALLPGADRPVADD